MPEKSVLFDFDGVIIDSFNAVLKINQAKNTALTAEAYRRRFDGNIGEQMAATLSPSDLKNFFSAYGAAIPGMSIVPGIREVIQTLAQKYILAIISTTHTSLIHSFLSAHDLSDAFQRVLGYDVDPDKTAKIKTFLTDEGMRPEQAVFVTDTLGDINEARSAKVQTIAVTWGFHSRSDLERGEPCQIVSVPEELPPAISRYFSKSTL